MRTSAGRPNTCGRSTRPRREPPTPPRRRSYTRASLETAQPGKTGIAHARDGAKGVGNLHTHAKRSLGIPMDLSRPALSPAGPALLAAQPLADRLDLAPPASLVAAHRDRQRVERLDMPACWASGSQPVSPSGEVAHGAGMLSAHALAMPRVPVVGKGRGEQSGHKSGENARSGEVWFP